MTKLAVFPILRGSITQRDNMRLVFGIHTFDECDFHDCHIVFEYPSLIEAELKLLEVQEYNVKQNAIYDKEMKVYMKHFDIAIRKLKAGKPTKSIDSPVRKLAKFLGEEVLPNTRNVNYDIVEFDEWVKGFTQEFIEPELI